MASNDAWALWSDAPLQLDLSLEEAFPLGGQLAPLTPLTPAAARLVGSSAAGSHEEQKEEEGQSRDAAREWWSNAKRKHEELEKQHGGSKKNKNRVRAKSAGGLCVDTDADAPALQARAVDARILHGLGASTVLRRARSVGDVVALSERAASASAKAKSKSKSEGGKRRRRRQDSNLEASQRAPADYVVSNPFPSARPTLDLGMGLADDLLMGGYDDPLAELGQLESDSCRSPSHASLFSCSPRRVAPSSSLPGMSVSGWGCDQERVLVQMLQNVLTDGCTSSAPVGAKNLSHRVSSALSDATEPASEVSECLARERVAEAPTPKGAHEDRSPRALARAPMYFLV